MGYIFDAIRRAEHSAPKPPAIDVLESPAPIGRSATSETPSPNVAPHEEDLQPLSFPTNDGDGDDIAGIDDRLVALSSPDLLMAEEYRSIRTTLLARCSHKRHLVHTITSATPQEGKTITSLNLGLSFGELHNRSVVAVEADLRLPTFGKLLGLDATRQTPGLLQYLREEASLSDLLQRVSGSRLCFIPAGGQCGAEAVQLLSSQRMTDLLKALRAQFDHVIVDTPPVTDLADAGILGAISDEVMLVVRMGQTPRPLIEHAVRTLHGYHAPVAGIIATDQRRVTGRYYYRYGYGYQYQQRKAA